MSDKVREQNSKLAIKELKEDYLRMLEESFQQTAEINKGDVIEAAISKIDESYIFVELGGKFDAYAEINEFSDEKGILNLKVGDTLKGFVVDKNDQGYVIGRSLTKQYVDKASIMDAYERKIPIQGKIHTLTKGGFNVDVLGARAFCPLSQIAMRFSEDNSAFIGKTMDFLVIECSENCRRIVVSHRILEEQVYDEQRSKAMENLKVGAVQAGKVMRMTTFGAFVDLGGVEGLMHVSEISWLHTVKPQDVLQIGQDIEVKILDIKGEKISLSMKALQENPFVQAMSEIKENDIVNCRVLRLHNFGAFAEIKPGVEGLIPVSEMSRNRNVGHPKEILKEGDFVQVQILRIDTDTQKISLSLKALQEDPWDKIDEIIQVNQIVEGIVESSTNFGVFISISDGVTGLLPRSRIRKDDAFKANDQVSMIISAIDKDSRRITLDYSDRTEEEALELKQREERPREPRREFNNDPRDSRDSRGNSGDRGRRSGGSGGRGRSDEEWRKYANQKETDEDNPFKDL